MHLNAQMRVLQFRNSDSDMKSEATLTEGARYITEAR